MKNILILSCLFLSLNLSAEEFTSSRSATICTPEDDVTQAVLRYSLWMGDLYKAYKADPSPTILQEEVELASSFTTFFSKDLEAIRQDCLQNGWEASIINNALINMGNSISQFLEEKTQDTFFTSLLDISSLDFYLNSKP